jgi:hypothetical protein
MVSSLIDVELGCWIEHDICTMFGSRDACEILYKLANHQRLSSKGLDCQENCLIFETYIEYNWHIFS